MPLSLLLSALEVHIRQTLSYVSDIVKGIDPRADGAILSQKDYTLKTQLFIHMTRTAQKSIRPNKDYNYSMMEARLLVLTASVQLILKSDSGQDIRSSSDCVLFWRSSFSSFFSYFQASAFPNSLWLSSDLSIHGLKWILHLVCRFPDIIL